MQWISSRQPPARAGHLMWVEFVVGPLPEQYFHVVFFILIQYSSNFIVCGWKNYLESYESEL